MLAQLKTVVLIKEAIKLAFFRLVEYLEYLHLWVWLQAQNGQKQSPFFWNSILVLRNEDYSMREIAKILKILCNTVYYSLHRTVQTGSNQKRKRNGRPQCTTEQEDKYIRVSSLRNRRLTSPQLAALLNSTRKTPVSTSTVKRRLRGAGLGHDLENKAEGIVHRAPRHDCVEAQIWRRVPKHFCSIAGSQEHIGLHHS